MHTVSIAFISGIQGCLGCPEDICKKFALVKDYKAHLRAVGFDRELEQYFEGLQPQNSDDPVLFAQIDGMDQSKWSVPRYPENKQSKDLSKYIRPRLKVVGCWMSGYLLSLYIADANFAHDASMTVEAVGTGEGSGL